MPQTVIDTASLARVLAECDVVRVAFRDHDETYLVPLGYTWMDGAMYGVTDRGRKTELAQRNPTVAFQTDTSARSGVHAWESVSGRARFEIVGDEAERARVIASFREFAESAPEWWRAEQHARLAAGTLLAWRLTPETMTGMRSAPNAP